MAFAFSGSSAAFLIAPGLSIQQKRFCQGTPVKVEGGGSPSSSERRPARDASPPPNRRVRVAAVGRRVVRHPPIRSVVDDADGGSRRGRWGGARRIDVSPVTKSSWGARATSRWMRR